MTQMDALPPGSPLTEEAESMFARQISDEELDDAVEHYRREGYAMLPRVAGEGYLARLRTRFDEIVTGKVTYPGLFFQADATTGRYEDLEIGLGWQGPSASYRKVEKLELDPLYRAWIQNEVFERIVRRQLVGRVTLYRAVVFAKAPRVGSDTPWHQDAGRFWGLSRDPELQLWTALDDAPVEAGCVEVYPGSHQKGLATPLGGVVPDPCLLASEVDREARALPARAGDVLLIHNHVWHRAGKNTTARARRALTVCYLHGDTRCLRTKHKPRQFVEVFGE